MIERDFSIQGREFKLRKLDTFKQFHIVRRLGPIIGEVIPLAQKLKAVGDDTLNEEQKFESIAQLLSPIMNGISKLSDEDANTVLFGLLSAVEMKQPGLGTWAMVVREGALMVQDIDLPTMLQIAGRAFAFNLSGFFTIAPQVSHGQK